MKSEIEQKSVEIKGVRISTQEKVVTKPGRYSVTGSTDNATTS